MYQREDIHAAISKFSSGLLRDNSLNLFRVLGYNTSREGILAPNTFKGFEESFLESGQEFDRFKALSLEWVEVELLFQLTEEEMKFNNSSSYKAIKYKKSGTDEDKVVINSYLFFAIQLGRSGYTSRQLSQITREVNKLFPMPVMIIFKYGSIISLAIIDRRLNKNDKEKDVLERVVLIKDVNINNPHRGQLEIIHSLCLKNLSVSNFVELHEAWRKVLTISELNKKFYKDITIWFYEAIKVVQLPNKPEYIKDSYEHNKNFLVRLLSRIMFCWFLKEKGLIDRRLLELVDMNEDKYPILKDINDSEFLNSNSYYRGILQNIFYKCLNEEKKSNKSYFAWTKYLPLDFDYSLFINIPYINGGTFDSMPEDNADEGIKDGDIIIPNRLFYGSKGLNTILSRYKFTIEENTPLVEDIALDPELLGLVFENLLAELDPNMDDAIIKSIRKQTGSYYTPRKVIEVMVNEALFLYLNKYFEDIHIEVNQYKEKIRNLIYFDTIDQPDKIFCGVVVDALDKIKILDPACGSGAFPMGMLQRMLRILCLVDPKNKIWIERQVERVDSVLRDKFRKLIEEHLDDYSRKLGIIRNCIYGIDIQPLAVQITKLRFFISLIVEQKVDYSKNNLGITPMPNLETKVICADSLNDIQASLMLNVEKLIEKREKYYQPDISHMEKGILADEIVADMDFAFPKFSAEVIGRSNKSDNKKLLKEWFMHGTVSSPFFNAKYFFPEVITEGGFDIVIGNPPYGGQKITDSLKKSLGVGSGDIYGAFIARFLCDTNSPVKSGGILAYIVSDTFMTIKTHNQLRQQMMKHKIHKMIRVHPDTFRATVNTAVIICERNTSEIEPEHTCQMVDMTNISFHKNYDRFIEILRNVVEMKSFESTSNEEYAIYFYKQSLIRLNSNLPFFVASPKLFAFLQDDSNVRTEVVDFEGNKVQARKINMNGKMVKVVKLGQIAEVKQGLATGDNQAYLFQNPEARGSYKSIRDYNEFLLTTEDIQRIQSDEKLRSDVILLGISKTDKRSKRYFGGRYIIPYDKGGESDAEGGWMPNYYVPTDYFIDWSEWAVNRMRNLTVRERNKLAGKDEGSHKLCSRFQNSASYFMESITSSRVGMYSPTFRLGSGTVYDSGCSNIFSKIDTSKLLAILTSKFYKYIFKTMINHTVNSQVEDNLEMPITTQLPEHAHCLVKQIIGKQNQNYRYDYTTNEQIDVDKLVYLTYGLSEGDRIEIETWYRRRYNDLI